MRIPGAGDLAPARRRPYGGSYGRRRRRRTVRVAVTLVLIAVAGGGAYLLRHDDTDVPRRLATTQPSSSPCPSAAPVVPRVALPPATSVRLVVLNGTPRSGLAKTVADGLAARGFVITGQGNATKAQAGGSTVVFGTGGQPAATLVSHWVRGARLVGDPRAARGSVQVVLGSDFQRLSTPAEVAAAASGPASSPSTAPTGCAA